MLRRHLFFVSSVLLSLLLSYVNGQSVVSCPLSATTPSNPITLTTAVTNLRNATCRYVGDFVSLNLRAVRRYDAQIYVGVNGQGAPLSSGQCNRYTLTPLLQRDVVPQPSQLSNGRGPFLDADGNACGDIAAGATTVFDMTNVVVRCADNDNDLRLDPVSTCVAVNVEPGASGCVTTQSTPFACRAVQLNVSIPADPNGCTINPCGSSYECQDVPGRNPADRNCLCPTGTQNSTQNECQVAAQIHTNGVLANLVGVSPLVYTVTFERDVPVASLVRNRVTVTGPSGTAVNFEVAQGSSARDWTITVQSGSTDGWYTLALAAGAGQSTTFRTIAVSKTVQLVSGKPATTVGSTSGRTRVADPNLIIFHFNFSKPVFFVPVTPEIYAQTLLAAGSNAGAIIVTYDWLRPSQAFDVRVVPLQPGPVTMTFPADVVRDDGGLGNLAADPFTIIWDNVQPSVVLSVLNTHVSVVPANVTAHFSESVLGNRVTSNAAINAIRGASSGVASLTVTQLSTQDFLLRVTPAAQGVFTVAIPGGLTFDEALNTNLPSAGLALTYATDLCGRNHGDCDSNARCDNVPGTRVCTCNPGYQGNGETCADVNECTTVNGACAENAFCTNTPGSRTCECPLGYDGEGYAWCNVSRCGIGFFFNQTSQECEDVNECSQRNGGCLEGTPCTNNNGSNTCGPCLPGYTGANTRPDPCIDINECATDGGGCDAAFTVCTNTPGSRACTDVNECATTNGGCAQVCDNLSPGRFCHCLPGYDIDPTNPNLCVDVNECAAQNGGCMTDLARCVNTQGSRQCICNTGYAGTGVGAAGCVDIDECATGASDCVVVAQGGVCTNTPGSHTCSCSTGYTGDGKRLDRFGTGCTNIDYCTQLHDCNAHATCLNTGGSRTCTCNQHYSGDGLGATGCVETNYCQPTNPCVPAEYALCTPQFGGFTCACPAGFTGAGTAASPCADVNECLAVPCDMSATCENTPGSYVCHCQPGYENQQTAGQNQCVDVNECQVENGGCELFNSTCTNTQGSRTCQCNVGFYGDGVNCADGSDLLVLVTPEPVDATATNKSPVLFRIEFSKAVPNFNNASLPLLEVQNGAIVANSVRELLAVRARTRYSVGITPATDPVDVYLTVPAAVAHDYGKPIQNTRSNRGKFRYVTVFPAPLVAPASLATNTLPVINVDFNQTTETFNTDDDALLISSGSNIAAVTILPGLSPAPTPQSAGEPLRKHHFRALADVAPDSQYHIVVTPIGVGPVTFTFPANVATDAAGNGNEASTFALNIFYDNSPLTVSVVPFLVVAITNPVFIVTFNKNVTQFDASYLPILRDSVTNADDVVIEAISEAVYRVVVTPTLTGRNVDLTLRAGAAKDRAGNISPAFQTVSIYYDPSVNLPEIAVTARRPFTNVKTLEVDVVTPYNARILSGDATLLAAEILALTAPSISAVTVTGVSTAAPFVNWLITLTVAPTIVGMASIAVHVPRNAYSIDTPEGAKPSKENTNLTIVFDEIPPYAFVSVKEPGGLSKAPVFYVNFTEPMIFPTIPAAQMRTLVDGGVAFGVSSTSISARHYELTVRLDNPTVVHWVNLTLRAGVGTDLAGNANNAAPTAWLDFSKAVQAEAGIGQFASTSDNRNAVWIPVSIILALIVLCCICCLIWWWYKKNRHEKVKDTNEDDEEVMRLHTGGGAGDGTTGTSDESKRPDNYDDPVIAPGTGGWGSTDSSPEDSVVKAKHVGSFGRPVYHIHYQAEEGGGGRRGSADAGADEGSSGMGLGAGEAHSSTKLSESPKDTSAAAAGGGQQKNSGALVWL